MRCRGLCALGPCVFALAVACDDPEGSPAAGGHDAGIPATDAGSDAAVDGPATDAGSDAPATPRVEIPGAPKRLAAGADLEVVGVTSNGWVVYQDTAAKAVLMVPLSGGTPTVLLPKSEAPLVLVRGSVVFAWDRSAAGDTTAPLRVWAADGGVRDAAIGSSVGAASASPDGARIVFTRNAAAGKIDVMGAGADLTRVTLLLPQIPLECSPAVTAAGARFLVEHCPTKTGPRTLTSFTAAWERTDLEPTRVPAQLDAAGLRALVVSASTAAVRVIPTDGAPALTELDVSVSAGVINPSGTRVVYLTSGGTLKTAEVSKTASPTTLAASGAQEIVRVSPTDGHVLYSTFRAGVLRDLYLVAETGGASATLASTGTAAVYGEGFTADGSRAVYFTAVDAQSEIGTLVTKPVSGASATTLGSNAWIARATTGTKVLFNDNTKTVKSELQADLRIGNGATNATKLIAAGAKVDFRLAPSKDYVAYAVRGASAGEAGLWVAGLPEP